MITKFSNDESTSTNDAHKTGASLREVFLPLQVSTGTVGNVEGHGPDTDLSDDSLWMLHCCSASRIRGLFQYTFLASPHFGLVYHEPNLNLIAVVCRCFV